MGGIRRSAHGQFESLRFLYRFDGVFCWKQRLFHCGVFPNATAAFSGRCSGRAAVSSGCATGKSPSAGAHEWRKDRSAPVFACLPVEICMAAVPDCSRLDMTHFAELRRMFKPSVSYRRLVPNEFFVNRAEWDLLRWRMIHPHCEIHRLLMC